MTTTSSNFKVGNTVTWDSGAIHGRVLETGLAWGKDVIGRDVPAVRMETLNPYSSPCGRHFPAGFECIMPIEALRFVN